jgi:hypothetical protein
MRASRSVEHCPSLQLEHWARADDAATIRPNSTTRTPKPKAIRVNFISVSLNKFNFT